MLPSKSELHRLLICAALADGNTFLRCTHTEAEDITATIDCLSALGAKISRRDDGFAVTPLNRADLPARCVLPCRESGSTLRFLLPLLCALGITGEFHMAGRLPQRPMAELESELTRNGIRLWRPQADILCCEGRLQPGDYILPGNVSSQYITGLLFALPLLGEDSSLTIETPIESADYIEMTIDALAAFGGAPACADNRYIIHGGGQLHSPDTIEIGGDWSNAAFWLVAGFLSGEEVRVHGLQENSKQGDRAVFEILAQMGADIHWDETTLIMPDINAPRPPRLTIDAAAIPDLVPILTAAAAVSDSACTTIIRNAARLRLKESDRLTATAKTLNALGACVTEEADGLRIQSVPQLRGGTVDAWGDHRIAMTAAVASCVADKSVTITGGEAVNKSYPQFWQCFANLGKSIELVEEA